MLTVLPCFTLIIRSFCIKPLCRTATAKSLQSHPTPCDPVDGSPPGSPVPGTLQARTLEWVAISFSSAWKWKVKVKSLSRVRLLATPCTAAHQAPPSMGFSRQEYWSGVPLPSPLEKPIVVDYWGFQGGSVVKNVPANAGKWKVKVKSLSRARPSATPWTAAFQAPLSMGFSRQEY